MQSRARKTNDKFESLRRSEQRAQLAIDVAHLGMWTWSAIELPDGVTLDERCREICGLPASGRLTRADVMARVHPEDQARIGGALQAAFDPSGSGMFSEDIRFLALDGGVRWAVARGQRSPRHDGGGCELFGSLVDISAGVGFNDRYRALFHAIDRGFCVVEVLFDDAGKAVDYRFLETNPRFVAETGLGDAVGRRMRELAPSHEQHWFDLYGEVARSGQPVRFEHEAQALGRWYDVYAYRVGDPLARQVGILFADITARRQAEFALREADRRKDEFLATLSHELRNPLAPLSSALEVLHRSNDPERAARLHAIMARQVDQLTRLVDDLMEVSRITRGHLHLRMAPVDLRGVVRAAIETSRPLLDAQRQSLAVELPDAPLPVVGDAMRLAQVLTNLLNNAARYGRPGGHVRLRAWRDGDDAAIAVRDDGIGIASDKLQSIFQPFMQLHREVDGMQAGLGIGLSLVLSLIERHGGRVVARSAGEGRGSEFIVRLPMAGASDA
jgi:signal transduction histidine kinase